MRAVPASSILSSFRSALIAEGGKVGASQRVGASRTGAAAKESLSAASSSSQAVAAVAVDSLGKSRKRQRVNSEEDSERFKQTKFLVAQQSHHIQLQSKHIRLLDKEIARLRDLINQAAHKAPWFAEMVKKSNYEAQGLVETGPPTVKLSAEEAKAAKAARAARRKERAAQRERDEVVNLEVLPTDLLLSPLAAEVTAL